ncbi:hypothetical protein F5Y18DRAFT_433691 [Xylariaceae sp. FL1019]|nr:hypothetical protein F5Y18DRAFT_433691 [Xylariaceae sp. FL1019]
MDSGSYQNIRRGANTPSSMSPSTPSAYKTNVNRTKTKKWVTAKQVSYDGDDWGNDYDDDYDDQDDRQDEPEPLPPPPPASSRQTNSRLPGQIGHQLPSSRIFSQPAATASGPSNYAPGPSAMRSPSGPPALQLQTQTGPQNTISSPLASQPAHVPSQGSYPSPAAPTAQNAGTGSTQSRFPPRKSSMGQQDRPEIIDRMAPNSDAMTEFVSSNKPERTASPAAKTLPFVRPSDIYKRMEEEKEKERLSTESGRPSMDSLMGRREGSSSPSQVRPYGEQRRRTSFESNDGSESARGLKPTLAPVAERKSEYGMEGVLGKRQAEQPILSHGPDERVTSSQQTATGKPTDEAQADAVKSRRFSTSPQLPTLARMSGFGFGDDFFSSSSDFTTQARPGLPTTSEEPVDSWTQPNPDRSPDGKVEKVQPASLLEGPKLESRGTPESRHDETVREEVQTPPVRPRLPGQWVSETPTIASEQPTPMERPSARGPSALAYVENASEPSRAASEQEPSDVEPTTEVKQLPQPDSLGVMSGTDMATEKFGTQVGKHDDAVASDVVAASAFHEHATPQSLPPLLTQGQAPAQSSSRPASTFAPSAQSTVLLTSASPTTQSAAATSASDFSPTAPLNTYRSDASRPDIVPPPIHQRKSTLSTIDTAVSPEKDSDKLHEEIIKSLSPPPLSPGIGVRPDYSRTSTTEPSPRQLTRESTYLSGVYDDYLSMAEDKSLPEVKQPLQAPAPAPAMVKPLNEPATFPASDTSRPRRFSWEKGAEEVALSPTETQNVIPIMPQEPQLSLQESPPDEPNVPHRANTLSPLSDDSLTASRSGEKAMSHQLSQVSQVSQLSSGEPDDKATLAAIEPPSPVSYMPKKSADLGPENANPSRLSLAGEKEKFLVDTNAHPALSRSPSPSPAHEVSIPTPTSTAAPMAFRDILNIESREQRILKLEETCEHFYAMDSGLCGWVTQMQNQANPSSDFQAPLPPPTRTGTQANAQLPYYQQMINASKSNLAATQPRRSSMGNVQALMAGQSSSFSGSGNQMEKAGAKSKELLHAAGVFGNKGFKGGVKLFNKGKSKLRERGEKGRG